VTAGEDLGEWAIEGGPAVSASDDPFLSDDAVRTSAWAERLRQKRVRDQARILGLDEADEPRGYWHADHVRREPVVDLTDPRTAEPLGVLGLAPGAGDAEVAAAYRRLAKAHHPDRWLTADESVRRQHAEEMLRVNAAYAALRAGVS
jgi:DnaJ-domain-containing protein 1